MTQGAVMANIGGLILQGQAGGTGNPAYSSEANG